ARCPRSARDRPQRCRPVRRYRWAWRASACLAFPPLPETPPGRAEPAAKALQIGDHALLCRERRLEPRALGFQARASDFERDHLLLERGDLRLVLLARGARFGER